MIHVTFIIKRRGSPDEVLSVINMNVLHQRTGENIIVNDEEFRIVKVLWTTPNDVSAYLTPESQLGGFQPA